MTDLQPSSAFPSRREFLRDAALGALSLAAVQTRAFALPGAGEPLVVPAQDASAPPDEDEDCGSGLADPGWGG